MLCTKHKKLKIEKHNRLLFFVLIIIIFVLNITFVYFATSNKNSSVLETSKKPKGHKIYNAEYFEYDPNSDKYRIIIAEGEGGSGEGGGSSGGGTSNNTGQGSINGNDSSISPGGTSGAGTSKNAGTNGTGVGNSSNNTGNQSSNKNADAIKKSIEESRRESIARILETAANRQAVESSIAEQESIYESIQKRIRQESINARINAERYNTSPTINVVIETVPPQTLPPVTTTHYDRPVASYEDIVPVENTIIPIAENINQTIPETTLKTFDMPIVETKAINESIGPGELLETNIVESSKIEDTVENNIEIIQTEKDTEEAGGNRKEKIEVAEGNNDDFGSTNVGKENSDQEPGELQDGNLNGFGYSESEGDFKNVKILELDREGGLGLANVGRSKSIINKILLLVIFCLMFIGTIKYTLSNTIKTKNKKSYF